MRFFQCEYITMPGWEASTENVREFSDLPKNAQTYINKIEELVGVPSKFIYYLLFLLAN